MPPPPPAPLPPEVPAAAIRVLWPDATQPPLVIDCPNCGTAGAKRHLLDVAWTAPKLPRGDRKPVLACPACTARFYPPLKVPNYHDPDVMDWGWHQFHIQQGAGLVPITAQLARIARGPGGRFLEIGCGYGFGLDFAIHALGWRGAGIDPSPMARLGAADLGLEIIDGYFPDDLPGEQRWDVIAATEVIEHVQRPADLLAALRARLTPDGVLLLTTPDGAAIDRATPDAALAQLLAPGIHMVFQTEASLRRLFEQAGFGATRIFRDGLTLIAYAWIAPAGTAGHALIDDQAAHRRLLRTYLESRSKTLPATTDAGLGLAARAMFEAAIDLDWASVAAIEAALAPAIAARFGLDLAALDALPPGVHDMRLAELKDAMPLNLGMILYAGASRRRADPRRREEAVRRFTLAAEAAGVLEAALARLSLNDGLASELAWRGAVEAALEAARTAAADAGARFLALPGLGTPEDERRRATWRGVIELVNAGAIEPARALLRAAGLGKPDSALPAPLLRDVRIVLGQLALAPGGDPRRAIAMADALGANEPVAGELRLGAFVRLVNAGEFDTAAAEAEAVGPLCLGRTDALGADATASLAVLIAHRADPETMAELLHPLLPDPAPCRKALLGAFIALVHETRYDSAAALAAAMPIEAWAQAPLDAVAEQASIALVALALATADPATLPARLARLPALSPAARADAAAQALIRLARLGRYDEGRALAAGIDRTALDPAARATLASFEAEAAIEAGDWPRLAELLAMLEAGPDPARARTLGIAAFTTAVGRGDFPAATALRRRIEPDFMAHAAAATEEMRGAGYALGILLLQDPAQPYRAEAAFAAVRRGYAAELAPDGIAPPLFWEALRGEMIALHRTDRGAEARALGRAMVLRHQGAPDDLARDLASVPG